MSSLCYFVKDRCELSLTFFVFKRWLLLSYSQGFSNSQGNGKKNLEKLTSTVMPETKLSQIYQ